MRKIINVALAFVLIVVVIITISVKTTDAKDTVAASVTAAQTMSYATEETSTQVARRLYTEADIIMLSKLLWGEARGVMSETEQAAVVWCVLNRVDAAAWPNTISEVITQPQQFVGYDPNHPVTEKLRTITEDVLCRWYIEKVFNVPSMRVLPLEYVYFTGNGNQNYFCACYENGTIWDWSLESPYES